MNKIKFPHRVLLFLFAISLNAIILFAFILLIQPSYEMADDYGYSELIANGYINISFSNYFLFGLINLIQKTIYPLNAYVFANIAFSFVSFVVLTILFCDKFNEKIALCLTLIVNGFFAINHYSTISFTRMPALLSVVGFVCVFNYIYKSKVMTFIGATLLIIGSMYRFEIFEVAIVIFFVFVISHEWINTVNIKADIRDKRMNYLKVLFEPKRLVTGIIIVAICFSSHILSNYINTSTDELKYYSQYTSARSQVWDYQPAEYESNAESYSMIDIDENDLAMLEMGYLDDEGAFSLDKLKEIRRITQNSKNDSFKDILHVVLSNFYSEVSSIRALGDKGILYFFSFIVLLLFILAHDNKCLILPLCFILIAVPFYLFLWITGKCPFRAVYVIWVSVIIYTLYSFDYNRLRARLKLLVKKHRKQILSICIVVSVAFAAFSAYISNIGNYTIDAYSVSNNAKECMDYINDNQNTMFVLARNTGLDLNAYNNKLDIYHTAKDTTTNSISFSCTYYRLPYYTNCVKRFGTDNLYSNLLKDNVIFVTADDNTTADNFEKYLEKYYSDKDVKYNVVNEIGNYQFVDYYV